ncbi:TBC1 domain family member 25 [Fukomys damarensis]|uniref:TBC1 domain family member 25 n=1 Tax=Fukomys damarensis TaxID=885580 RepID=A0A091D237_FUKDA|nr:TBC1 domain family member 25 [Fukomys damarensis]
MQATCLAHPGPNGTLQPTFVCFCGTIQHLAANSIPLTLPGRPNLPTLNCNCHNVTKFWSLQEAEANSLFCHRWLLLELSQEFAFDSTLQVAWC